MALPSELQNEIISKMSLSRVLALPLSRSSVSSFIKLRYNESYASSSQNPTLAAGMSVDEQWFCVYREHFPFFIVEV
jgi:hypothetical protein